MKTTYIASASEAANLYSGKQTAIVTLVKPQPYIDEKGHIKQGGWNYGKTTDDKPALENFAKCKASYTTGQIIGVRESWNIEAWDCQGYIRIKYKDGSIKHLDSGLYEDEDKETNLYVSLSDYLDSIGCQKDEEDNYIDFCLPWRSPVTMPRSAIRTHLLVKDVLCVRVRDMTSEQAQAIWPDMGNIERMQELHRKFGSDAWVDNVFIFITTIEKQ